MSHPAILHVTSLFGGGVERHLRDIVAGIDRPQLIWHAGRGIDVIEDPASHRFWPLAPEATTERSPALAAWLRGRGIGLVHLHQLTEAPRRRAHWACEQLGLRALATLHDILFLRADAFSAADPLAADAAWLDQTAQALRNAAAVLAPSRWLADLATARIPGLEVSVVPNGSRWPPDATAPRDAPGTARAAFTAQRTPRVVALLGALGPHKGSDLVEAVAESLEGTDTGLVVIGYLENRFHPGWIRPGRLFMHGAYGEGEAPGLLKAYGADLVLMPNTVPESFSYALSDAWSAGVPVLAAPAGALAERIGANGGGWLLPAAFDASIVAQRIRQLLGGDQEGERQRVQSLLRKPDPGRVPPLDVMTRSLDAFYARFGIDPTAPESADAQAIEALVARNLDGALFRAELVRLADELAQALASLETMERARRRGEIFEAETRAWIAKLESDVAGLQASLRAATSERDALASEADQLRLHKEALDRLPSLVRRALLKLAFHARR